MIAPTDQDFIAFCQLTTDAQLENILRKEFQATRT